MKRSVPESFLERTDFFMEGYLSGERLLLPEHKNDLLQLIEDFKISKDLGPVEKLIEPYIQ